VQPKQRFVRAYCIAGSHETNSISATTAKALVVEVPGVPLSRDDKIIE